MENGGFKQKGFTFSGKDPDDNHSADKKSVTVDGMIWYPKEDCVDELNFAKTIRGRKCENKAGIPERLTMRLRYVAKVAEIFDPLGKITPIIAGMKLDVSQLHRSGLT